MGKIEKIRISKNTMEKKNFFAPLASGLHVFFLITDEKWRVN